MSAPVRNALRSTAIAVVICVVIYLISNALIKGSTLDVGSLVGQLVIFAVIMFVITVAISAFFGNRVRTGSPR